jgi:hypothetical protein
MFTDVNVSTKFNLLCYASYKLFYKAGDKFLTFLTLLLQQIKNSDCLRLTTEEKRSLAVGVWDCTVPKRGEKKYLLSTWKYLGCANRSLQFYGLE